VINVQCDYFVKSAVWRDSELWHGCGMGGEWSCLEAQGRSGIAEPGLEVARAGGEKSGLFGILRDNKI
jgi:hypothetical protein